MNRKDLPIIVLLFALLIAWPFIYKRFFAPPPRPPAQEAEPPTSPSEPQASEQGAAEAEPAAEPGLEGRAEADLATRPAPAISAAPEPAEPETAVEPESEREPAAPEREERRERLSTPRMQVAVSSWGGGVVNAELKEYPQTLEPDSPPVTLDFMPWPALTYTELPGLDRRADFELGVEEPGAKVRLTRTLESGLELVRTVSVAGDYSLEVTDVFSNKGPSPVSLPEHGLQVGPMAQIESKSHQRGFAFLGIDALLAGGRGVRHWGRKKFLSGELILDDLFLEEQHRGGCMMFRRLSRPLPAEIDEIQPIEAEWLGAKNKFFVQIVRPEDEANKYRLYARRAVSPRETKDNPKSWAKAPVLEEVRASIRFPARALGPGESFTRKSHYFVGPKKFALLKDLGHSQGDAMNFGLWAPVCKVLLMALNGIYGLLPNYGVAIILLTILIRVLFWPVTHKNSAHMKKMQDIQPLLKELRAKHKDNPRRLQEETMALYKEHKVNPLGGCLPMLIQIPVFIALFGVLRSAVELRFAPFLWIPDLSEPEGLLAGMLPGGFSLNILPIFMSATMFIQQKLTPAAGDPNQQKMMAFMPLMMLFFFYNMPSALVLYWSTNQCLMIGQLLIQKRRKAAKEA
ncbi:MAG: membrane protein insertase YidC [Kiritimatiellae bacterium]|nr:membrane protein insertase YidC [Kiritimatiellia bacterium]